MDRTVPAAAAYLLNWLGGIEAPQGYGTIYGNNQKKLAKPLTAMTIREVIAAGPTWTKLYKSSAAGRYQFMNNTLTGLKSELGLRDAQVFTPDLQDRLGFHLLRRRGYDKWAAGSMSLQAFALNIAKEWASIPVLSDMQGNKRAIKRGQSYYAGDALNKSLVTPEAVERAIAAARKLPTDIPILSTATFQTTPAAPVIPTEIPVVTGPAPVPGIGEPVTQANALIRIFQSNVATLRKMNPEQAGSLFRTLLQVGGGVLATKGYIGGEEWETISGGLLTALMTAWGVWARSDTNLVASAAGVPAVHAIVVDSPKVADSVSDERVATLAGATNKGLV